jgi:hypothetical protein
MISQKFLRLRRAVWSWRQPLTRLPNVEHAPISDLFVWRSSDMWQTFFELIDIPSLFEDGRESKHVDLIFFDKSGHRVLEQRIDLRANSRQTLNISSLIGRVHGEVGTFAVFHSTTPISITKLGSFLTERGYISYRYLDAPLKAYVHGNLDAIAQGYDGKLQLLGGISFLRRAYNIQYEFQPSVLYELAMVNSTHKPQCCICELISVRSGKIMSKQMVNLAPGEVQLITIQANKIEPIRCVINSNLVMGRPLVFRIQNFKLDVFHS